MLFAAWSAQKFLTRMNRIESGSRWWRWWIAVSFVVMCVLFALTPDLRPQSPWVMEYCFAYAAAQLPALVTVIRLCLRYARQVGDAFLRLGLRLVVAGTAGAVLYLVNKTVLAASPRFGFAYPPGHTVLLGTALPAAAHVLVLLGVALPALTGWLSRYRLHRRLRPLWTALYRADPAIALAPTAVPDVFALTGLRMRLYRRVIEIRDGLLALRPYQDPRIAAAAREEAARAGFRGQRLETEIEAAVVAAALRARDGGGAVPNDSPVLVSGGRDLDSDTAFLADVAHAYRRRRRGPG